MLRELLLSYCLASAGIPLAEQEAPQPGPDLAAAGFAGIDDGGNCVRPCKRAGGRPCAPCLPAIGPTDPGWASAIVATAMANQEFKANIESLARTDSGYRGGPAYPTDRKAYMGIEKSLGAILGIGSFK